MPRWLSSFLVGVTLALTSQAVVAEEDPFGPPPPLPPENAGPVLPPVPKATTPAQDVPVTTPRRVVAPAVPTEAQKRVHERAAEAALQRKARIQQRKQSPPAYTPATFPTTGPLSHPALSRYDRGIAIAFRPIQLSGLDPLPTTRPVRSPVRKKPVAPVTTSGKPPVEQPVPPESIMSTSPAIQR